MSADARSLIIVASILGISGCTEAPAEKVWVGHLAPLTGPDENIGASARRGVLLAVEEANETPETEGAGRHVEVRHADTRGETAAFGAAATRLLAVNDVAALLGGSSIADLAEIKHIDRPGVLLIAPAGLVQESLSGEGLFFTGLSPRQQGAALARLAVKAKLGRITLLVNAEDRDAAHGTRAEAFIQVHRETWASEHKTSPTLQGPRRFGKEISIEDRARALAAELVGAGADKKPDAIFVAGKVADVVKLRGALPDRALPVIFAGEEGSLPELRDEPRARDNVYAVTAYPFDEAGREMDAFSARFKKRFQGREPDVHAALAYDNARLLFQAMRLADGLAFEDVNKALAGMKAFQTLAGPLTFDKTGQARRPAYVVHVEKGMPKTVGRFAD